jgi:hypothetical protein
MATPEGRIKEQVKRLLACYKPDLYSHWPVMNGMGEPTLDCIGAVRGRMFAIETKAPGKKPTPRQELTILKMQQAGIVVFVIDGDLNELADWLHKFLPL